MRSPWLFLQLVDGAFPAGGLPHSQGLEASLQLGGITDIDAFLEQTLWQVGRSALPFVRASCAGGPARLDELDRAVDAMLPSHVANRASRAQGRAFALAVARVFDEPAVHAVADHARSGPAHHAPIFGALFAAVGLAPDEAEVAFLHGTARSVLSAAVRLGALGPLEAQRLQVGSGPMLDRVLASCTDLPIEDAAQTAPLVELFGALHDRLDGRLFQS